MITKEIGKGSGRKCSKNECQPYPISPLISEHAEQFFRPLLLATTALMVRRTSSLSQSRFCRERSTSWLRQQEYLNSLPIFCYQSKSKWRPNLSPRRCPQMTPMVEVSDSSSQLLQLLTNTPPQMKSKQSFSTLDIRAYALDLRVKTLPNPSLPPIMVSLATEQYSVMKTSTTLYCPNWKFGIQCPRRE